MFVFDLDGTLSDPTHRLHHITEGKKDWRAFYAACGGDAVIPHAYSIWLSLCEHGDVAIVSGRSNEVREKTLAWLLEHEFFYDYDFADASLFMRSEGDKRPDTVVKPELLREAMEQFKSDPKLIFEDRTSVVNTWREMGIPCYQVAPGDF